MQGGGADAGVLGICGGGTGGVAGGGFGVLLSTHEGPPYYGSSRHRGLSFCVKLYSDISTLFVCCTSSIYVRYCHIVY